VPNSNFIGRPSAGAASFSRKRLIIFILNNLQ